jgi:hypothetical protein
MNLKLSRPRSCAGWFLWALIALNLLVPVSNVYAKVRLFGIPFPVHDTVDKQFSYSHLGIANQRSVYDWMINHSGLNADPNHAPSANLSNALNDSEPPPSPTQQIIDYYTGTLHAGEVQSITVPIEAVAAASFGVTAQSALSVTLINPTGDVIDPATPGTDPQILYKAAEPAAEATTPRWSYQYLVEEPSDGIWHMQVTAAETTEIRVTTTGATLVKVGAYTDKTNYRPGEIVTVEAVAIESTGGNTYQLSPGVALSGLVRLSDNSTFPLTFFDDGTNGDIDAANEIYTAQFPAPNIYGDFTVLVEGTKGNLHRINGVRVHVYNLTATIRGVSGERTSDTNGNGRIDELELDVVIDVAEEGNYDVVGDLLTPSGQKLAHGVFSSVDSAGVLTTGLHTVTLSFWGQALREAGFDGPYVLDNVAVQRHAGEFPLPVTMASARTIYTTTTYMAEQFDGERLRVLATSSLADDLTGDSLYESLTISVTFDVLLPGRYEWFGMLVAPDGVLVGQASGRGQLDSQTPAAFVFTGGRIAAAQRNGPFRLTDVYVTTAGGNAATEYFYDVHTTLAYAYTEFESMPIAFHTSTQALLDLNGSGLADVLVISATVAAVALVCWP